MITEGLCSRGSELVQMATDGPIGRSRRVMTVDVRVDRINRGLSQQALADAVGVSVDVIRNLEDTGNRPHPANALKVAQFYGRSVVELWPSGIPVATKRLGPAA